jgi:hypothetical protein
MFIYILELYTLHSLKYKLIFQINGANINKKLNPGKFRAKDFDKIISKHHQSRKQIKQK